MENSTEQMLLEILRMARELVINEYTDRRAQDHNEWLYESERLWATRRMKLKYPIIPPYPTEQDIIERAQILLKFLVLGDNEPAQPIILPVDLPQPVEVQPEVEEVVPEPIVEETQVEPIVEPVVETQPPLAEGIFPSVLKKFRKKSK